MTTGDYLTEDEQLQETSSPQQTDDLGDGRVKTLKVNYLNTNYTMTGVFLASKLLLHFLNPHF